MDNKETFNYTYSAKEHAEIKAIRDKYIASEQTEDKIVQLRRLDAGVTKKATAVALAFGIVGALILGFGMSLIMTEISMLVGHFGTPVGIFIGVLGIILVSLAYPLYNRTLKKERERIAPEILRLTDELIK